MRFSAAAVAALVGILLDQPSVDVAASHPGTHFQNRRALLPRSRFNHGVAKPPVGAFSKHDEYVKRSVLEASLSRPQNALRKSPPRPLWEQETEEETVEAEMKQVDLGILANTKRNERDRSLVAEEVVSCVELNAEAEIDCDCSGFDETTLTGTFTCSFTEQSEYFGITYTFDATEDPGTYSLVTSVILSEEEGLGYSYSVFYEDGVLVACTATSNGCECICNLGVCPDDPLGEITSVSFECPGLVLDACSQEDWDTEAEMVALLAKADKCSPAPFPGAGDVVGTETSTVVPSMGETVSETMGETLVTTMIATDESAAVQRGGG